jgi:hypothetical protein
MLLSLASIRAERASDDVFTSLRVNFLVARQALEREAVASISKTIISLRIFFFPPEPSIAAAEAAAINRSRTLGNEPFNRAQWHQCNAWTV